MSLTASSGLVGVSSQTSLVRGRHGLGHVFGIGRVNEGEVEPVAAQHLVEQAICAAVDVVSRDHVVAAVQEPKHSVGSGHAGCECQTVRAALECRQACLKRQPRGVLCPRVLVALARPADAVLDVGRRLDRSAS